ncbi:MAG: hypothetical protein JSS83_27820, partial [Cyanobacteria bacterium SZAS LIN-3]|nr:hypothetical protein [Cyanobacteria bacterium SZAS LIN-3]
KHRLYYHVVRPVAQVGSFFMAVIPVTLMVGWHFGHGQWQLDAMVYATALVCGVAGIGVRLLACFVHAATKANDSHAS